MQVRRCGGRALASALVVMWTASGCAGGGEVMSSGASLAMADPLPGTTTDAPPPPPPDTTSGTTTAPESTSGDTEELTGSMITMEAACGDGMPDPGEECDDGNLENTDECTNACKLPACGDLFVQAGEACDDGNLEDTDDCTSTCAAATCGDGFVHAGIEACDDGNLVDGDACSSLCTIPGCGDGVLDMMTEQCDDANPINTDACTATCMNAVCGDGILYEGVEQCDDANLEPGDGCEPDCTITQKFTAVGPQVNFPANLLSGWTQCWSGTYDGGTPLAEIVTTCSKANLMLACRPIGSPNFTLLAHAPREAVLLDTGNSNIPTVANGTGWYFNDSHSWGFAKQDDTINRTSCDYPMAVANAELRMCWHTNSASVTGGYRCGTNEVNPDAGWERVILHAD